MQLLRITEFLPAADGHLFRFRGIRIWQTLLQRVEFLINWYFDFSCNTSTDICAKLRGVSNSKTVWRSDSDLILFSINFFHTFDFSKSHSVAIAEPVLLLIVKIDDSYFVLGDSSNVNWFLLFTIGIDNFMVISEVDKDKAIESQIATIEESNIVLSRSFIELN